MLKSSVVNQGEIDADAAALRKAMKGIGTDENAIIKIVANRTQTQRIKMIESYKRQFNRDLIKDLKDELDRKLEKVVIALFTDPITYDCEQLKQAMKGSGTDEDTLIEIIATRPNWWIKQLHEKYRQLYGKELITDLCDELSGDLKKCIVALAQCCRSEKQQIDQNYCKQKAEELYKAGEGKLGTNEEVFFKILTESSPGEIYGIDSEYTKISKKTLIKAIESEFSGSTILIFSL